MRQLSIADLERLITELSHFSKAGIAMPEGLYQLEKSLEPGLLKSTAGQLSGELQKGVRLSEALRKMEPAFPAELSAIVRCGEESGDLRSILEFTAQHSRKLSEHRAALFTAVIYPLIVLCLLVVVVLFIFLKIIPKFKEIYDQLGAELPGPTMLLVEINNVLLGTPLLLPAIMLAIVLTIAMLVWPDGRRRFQQNMASLPGFGGLTTLSDTSMFTKFVGFMTARGMALDESLRIASVTVWHPRMRNTLLTMADAAAKGIRVGPLLAGSIPATAAWLFEQAEMRGNLPDACSGISAYCDDRFDRLSKRVLSALEPMLLIMAAFIIGFIVVSLYLPLFNIPKIVGRD
jgi:type IV pilus assembly protein PilC